MATRQIKFIGNTETKPISFCGKLIGWHLQNTNGTFELPFEIYYKQ